VDISQSALAVASAQNLLPSTKQYVSVDGTATIAPRFVQADVLEVLGEFPGAPFDVITANPPYIRESERAAMHRNVLDHEPGLALFVPDDDPLVFYRAIASWAQRFLRPGGWGIVEINEALGNETATVFVEAGLKSVKKVADFFGKDRFISFQKAA
jgi:release factor glutamine methyltransferase